MTPHLEADKGAYADIVLLPGDPLRAQWIAETFLEDLGCVNRVRNMLGFTGSYRGRRVSVQATGMGIPSAAIYVTELLKFYGARTLVRVGTCGALASRRKKQILGLTQRDITATRLVLIGDALSRIASLKLFGAAAPTAQANIIAYVTYAGSVSSFL